MIVSVSVGFIVAVATLVGAFAGVALAVHWLRVYQRSHEPTGPRCLDPECDAGAIATSTTDGDRKIIQCTRNHRWSVERLPPLFTRVGGVDKG